MARASKAKTGKKSAPKRIAQKAAKPKAVKAKKASAAKPGKAKVAKKSARTKAKVAKAKRAAPRKSKAERAHDALVANAQHALELKNSAPKPFRPENRTPSKGMPPLPSETIAAAGAIEAEEAYSAKGRTHRSG